MWIYIKYLILVIVSPNGRQRHEYGLFLYLNKTRKKEKLWKLKFQNDLRSVARKHSQDMAAHDYFAHEGRSGTTPKDRFENLNISEVVAGENLAKIRGFTDPIKRAHVGLMNSPGHKANILSTSYNCVGIGVAVSKNQTYYYTQNFSYRHFVIKGLRKRLWFRKKLRLTFYRIVPGKTQVLLRIYDTLNNSLIDEQTVGLYKKRTKALVELPRSKKYKIEAYDLKSSKLLNSFFIQKMI